jgi:hypothetical protein
MNCPDGDSDGSDGEEFSDEGDDHIKHISAQFRLSTGPKGRIEALLIDRNELHGENFHSVCDEESQDLQSVGCAFCTHTGKLRVAVEGDGASRAGQGGFLYISSISTPTAYTSGGASDVAAEAIRQFCTLLDGQWTLVVYVCLVSLPPSPIGSALPIFKHYMHLCQHW